MKIYLETNGSISRETLLKLDLKQARSIAEGFIKSTN